MQPVLILDPSLDPPPLRAGLVWGLELARNDETGEAPAWLSALLSEALARGESWFDPGRKAAVRSMLRFGSYKPAGRSKPSSEYLLAAALSEEFPLVNAVVDINNGVSLRFGYPASVFDISSSGAEFLLRRGRPCESYVFNRSGQSIDLRDLLCVCGRGSDAESWIPIGNPVKDSMATKVFESARDIAAVLYAPSAGIPESDDPGGLESACATFAGLLASECGASKTGWSIL
jgi:DNA/RNA-binding domain of Phe-tRNA-synthetase-like protein